MRHLHMAIVASQKVNLLMHWRSKPNVKNGCDAKIGGCLNEDEKWVLQTLNLQHNHGLSPELVQVLKKE